MYYLCSRGFLVTPIQYVLCILFISLIVATGLSFDMALNYETLFSTFRIYSEDSSAHQR